MNFILHFCGILLGKIVTNHIHTRIITDNSCIYAVISIFQRSLLLAERAFFAAEPRYMPQGGVVMLYAPRARISVNK